MIPYLLVAASCYSFYCYSSTETVYGTTGNAASDAYTWAMTQILPQQAGLQVSNVFYRYTAVKDPSADMTVAIQNENLRGSGYTFREVDDWSGKPGTTINKLVPTGGIDISYWGQGSIDVTGEGSVENASVIYSYSYEPCFDPQSSPECPGYVDPFVVQEVFEYKDPLDDELIQSELDREVVLNDEEQEEKQRLESEKEANNEERLEVALGAVNAALMTAQAVVAAEKLMAMNSHIQNYQVVTIQGGQYKEESALTDAKLPENRKGLRVGLAQQVLHEELVQSQYQRGDKK
jgi:hypothetical protein